MRLLLKFQVYGSTLGNGFVAAAVNSNNDTILVGRHNDPKELMSGIDRMYGPQSWEPDAKFEQYWTATKETDLPR